MEEFETRLRLGMLMRADARGPMVRRGGRERKLRVIFLSCIIVAVMWSALLWHGLYRVQHTMVPSASLKNPKEAEISSGWLSEGRPSLCTTFLSNITTSRFYPKRFFEEGGGKPFLTTYEQNRNVPTNILNARFLVFDSGRTANSGHDTGCSIVHYHIHKNGGTTLERHVPLPTDNYYSKREKAMGHRAFEAACTKVMEKVWREQQHQAMWSVRTFTFLRDPVPRFLSSVAQVLKLKEWHTRLYPCYEKESTEILLDCVLDMLETGNFPEMHLAPQSFELYKQVMTKDIFVEVVDLTQIGLVMEQLGAKRVPKERSTIGSVIRRFPSFRLTMDALNESRIRRICKVYAVDVEMIEETRVAKTICTSLTLASN